MINGNIEGIRKSILNELESLIDYEIPRDMVLDDHVVNILLDTTQKINKEILIIIDHSNKVAAIGVGEHNRATFPNISKLGRKRGLNGLRSFHTHPGGNPSLSSADKSSLVEMKFNLLGAIGVSSVGQPIFNIGFIHLKDEDITVEEYGPLSLNVLNRFQFREYNEQVDKYLRQNVSEDTLEEERALLVGVNIKQDDVILEIDHSMEELKELAHTASAITVAMVVQNKEKVDNTFYVGKGKLEEMRMIIQNNKANLVICNDELSSIQLKVMETYLGVKIIDRTSLILDIFARHAKTKEGKLQVELAQLRYRLPRLLGLGKVLSRTGGGIGTRGPGEKKLETDRRAIYREINILENRIKSMKKIREQQKSQRKKNQVPIISLVGYTNAGKSTLFNLLTDSKVLSENKLFATLDATTRKFKDSDQEVLLSDTVGFIDKLPHDLVKAFESTLEGVIESDLLLHVIDSSNESFLKQIQLVEEVLRSLKEDNKKIIYVFNKIDKKCEGFEEKYSTIRGTKATISAKYEMGISELLSLIQKQIYGERIVKEITIPYEDMSIISSLHNHGIVLEEKYEEEAIKLKVQYTEDMEYMVRKYL